MRSLHIEISSTLTLSSYSTVSLSLWLVEVLSHTNMNTVIWYTLFSFYITTATFFLSIFLFYWIKPFSLQFNNCTIALYGDALKALFTQTLCSIESRVIYAFWRSNIAVNGKMSVNNSLVTFFLRKLKISTAVWAGREKKLLQEVIFLCWTLSNGKTCLFTLLLLQSACAFNLCRTAPKKKNTSNLMNIHINIEHLSSNQTN